MAIVVLLELATLLAAAAKIAKAKLEGSALDIVSKLAAIVYTVGVVGA
jgi:hypothetical protein